MYVEAYSDDGVAHACDLGVELGVDATHLAAGEQQIVGPPNVGRERGDVADGILHSEPCSQREPENVGRRDLRPQQDADVKAGACGGVPFVRTASATAGLLVSKVDGAALLRLFGL